MNAATLNTPRPLVSVEKWRELTYLGRRARVLVEHHDKKRDGLRTITTEWIDAATPENGGHAAGTVVRKVCEGDGRYVRGPKAFRLIVAETVVA